MDHFYQEILPDYFDFADLYSQMVQEAASDAKFVEVGSLLGRSSCFLGVEIVNSGKNISVDFIDPWFKYDEDAQYADKVPDRKAYITFLNNIGKVEGLQHRAIRLESKEASTIYADESLDFVFIDGDHSYNAVMEDLKAWYHKVKPGGVIAGHDYWFHEVSDAVQNFFKEIGVPGQITSAGSCWIWRKGSAEGSPLFDA